MNEKRKRKLKQGIITVECALLSFIVLSVSLFFWSFHSNISNYSELDVLIYESIVDVKDELYLYSKIEEYMQINQHMDDLISKIEDRIHLDLDNTYLKNSVNSTALNHLIERKIKSKFSKDYAGDLKIKFHLKTDPIVKTSVKSGNLVVKTYLHFDLPSIIPFLDEFTSCIHHEVGCRNIDKLLFEGDASSHEGTGNLDDNSLILTKNGILSTKIYHTDKNCFGLRFAKTIMQLDLQSRREGKITYNGETFHLCYFCKLGKKRAK